jgi:type II secretory pathway component GspD/PulD (secretin)
MKNRYVGAAIFLSLFLLVNVAAQTPEGVDFPSSENDEASSSGLTAAEIPMVTADTQELETLESETQHPTMGHPTGSISQPFLPTETPPESEAPPETEQLPPSLEGPSEQPPVEATSVQPSSAVSAVSEDSSRITLDIKGMDVVDVLQLLAKRANLNIIVGKNVTGRVTLFLKDVSVEEAFEIILLSNNLASERTGEIINVMTQADYEQMYGQRYQDKSQVKIIQLKHVSAADIAVSLKEIKSKNGRIVVDTASNTVALIDLPEKLVELTDFIEKTDQSLESRVFELNYASVEKLKAKVEPVLTKGLGTINIDERTNKMVVTDLPEKLDMISRVIAAFDEKSLQVVIDAQIVEISPEKDQFAMGVDWDYWLKKNMRFVGNLPAPSLTNVAAIPNALSMGVAAAGDSVTEEGQYKAVLDLLRVIGKTKILSSPRIMALNNQEARILVGTKEAYITSSTAQSASSAVTSQTVNFVDVGIKLYVTPTVNRDGFVTMKIRPEISSSKTTDLIFEDKVTQIPIVTTSESETTIMVKDGTTIIIAGLKKDSQDKEVKKVPVIGDVPLVGFFFRSTKSEVIKTELVIFITPHIVTGEEPVGYKSLTGDQDILKIHGDKMWP